MQAYARVCNKINKNSNYKKKFYGKRCEFEGPYRKSRRMHQDDILKDDSQWHKGISTTYT